MRIKALTYAAVLLHILWKNWEVLNRHLGAGESALKEKEGLFG
jgi:hypothetical protein